MIVFKDYGILTEKYNLLKYVAEFDYFSNHTKAVLNHTSGEEIASQAKYSEWKVVQYEYTRNPHEAKGYTRERKETVEKRI